MNDGTEIGPGRFGARRCATHKRYEGARRPRVACEGCWLIWLLNTSVYPRTAADARAIAKMHESHATRPVVRLGTGGPSGGD